MDSQCPSCGGFCKKSGCERTNVKAQPEQEPIAYLCENAVGHKYFRWKKPSSEYKPIALYTAHASPQREWQGLTDEDLEFWASELGQGELGKGVLRAVADHLKEKNT